ncbi:unannotated protein [freshwater metagenome]|uniref:Unannotated protein n=1 Tax=freshwater metagenome TaxID=449393 RepID=A0A6J6LHT3_9ZZZZ
MVVVALVMAVVLVVTFVVFADGTWKEQAPPSKQGI